MSWSQVIDVLSCWWIAAISWFWLARSFRAMPPSVRYARPMYWIMVFAVTIPMTLLGFTALIVALFGLDR